MTPEETVQRERDRALPVALAVFGGIALIAASIALSKGAPQVRDDAAEYLRYFPHHRGSLLITSSLQAAGTLFLIVPLFFLFQAADARSEKRRSALLALTVAGPLLLALGSVLTWVGADGAVHHFGTPPHGTSTDDYANDVLNDEATFKASSVLGIAGTLGTIVAVVYTSMQAMRVGLLSRLWGSLGIALGIFLLFPPGVYGILIFFFVIGLLAVNLWPGGRPRAWDTGTAIQWARPAFGGSSSRSAGRSEDPGLPPGASGGEAPNPPRRRGERRKRKGQASE